MAMSGLEISEGGIIQSLTAFLLWEELLKLAGGDVTAWWWGSVKRSQCCADKQVQYSGCRALWKHIHALVCEHAVQSLHWPELILLENKKFYCWCICCLKFYHKLSQITKYSIHDYLNNHWLFNKISVYKQSNHVKVAQNSSQRIPRLRFWCVIITTLYQLMLQSWYQKTAQSLVNTLVLFSWHNRLL